MPEQDLRDLTAIRSRVAELSLTMPTGLSEAYQRSMDATEQIRVAEETDGAARETHIKKAIDAMEDARPEVPDECDEDWQDCIDALEEVNDG